MNRLLAIALILFCIGLGPTIPATTWADEFFVGSWNLENLFDTKDDPSVKGDEEYTPESAKHWTKERLDIKLTNLAKIISKMNENKGPDVLGVCEIENRETRSR
jgi:hypothetical protein